MIPETEVSSSHYRRSDSSCYMKTEIVVVVKYLVGIGLCCLASCLPCRAEGFSAEESVRQMKVADGFRVEVVAAEPLVRQPVAIEFDDRGRLWVIQYLQYPNPAGLERIKVDRYSRTKYDRVPRPPPHGPRGADRITILSDSDHDGRMDVAKDFVSGLNLATGIAFGHGGVFVLNVPYLLFYPDRDRNDVPDSDPEVLVVGFGMEDAHSVANSLTWGPDGWLYGCQGSTVTANIRGIEFQQGVWRYHPVRKEFELFCEGGGNSWGLDFDATGNLLYSTNYGGYVLLHGVQGGYFTKTFAKHGELHNPYAYGYFGHAPHENFRGGHVTVGGIVYQADQFPESFRGTYIGADLLEHGVYWHKIETHGSTFRTSHGGELLTSQDRWFAPTDVVQGPDGAIYVSDWHDQRTAHPDPDADWDRSNGRIFRIVYEKPESVNRDATESVDFAKLSRQELLELHQHKNQWWVRRARAELIRRHPLPGASDNPGDQLAQELLVRATAGASEVAALEAFWTLASLDLIDEETTIKLLDSPHAAVRAWNIRSLGDRRAISEHLAHILDRFAEQESSVRVRQQLASTAKRLPAKYAVPLINANIIRDVDNGDPYLPLLWWWAVERHSVSGRDEVMRRFVRPTLAMSQLGRETLLPRLIRRYAAEGSQAGWESVSQLVEANSKSVSGSLLWEAVLAGWNEQTGDRNWEANAVAGLSRRVHDAWLEDRDSLTLTRLAVMMGHHDVLNQVVREAFKDEIKPQRRADLLGILASTQNPQFIRPALGLLSAEESIEVKQASLRLLSQLGSDDVAAALINLLVANQDEQLHSSIRDILLSRPAAARLFLAAIQGERIDPQSVPIEQIRKVALLNDDRMDAIVVQHWGSLKPPTPGEKLAEVRRLNNDLRAGEGNVVEGKKLFTQHCASCHTLFGEGAKLGPDLTSANRGDREFLLVSLVDPNNVIRKEYMSVIVHTRDGRVLTGLPVDRNQQGLILRDGKNDIDVTVASSEIVGIHDSPVSFMPSDLYRQLNPQQLRDLFAYLQLPMAE